MSYTELKFYLTKNLEAENYFTRVSSLNLISRAEDILLSRRSMDLNEYAEIIQEEIKEHDNPDMLLSLRNLTRPFILIR